jgi:CDP-glucose 4,6-dehydratase
MADLSFWGGRKVFLTGHTGFMGGWLSSFLLRHGAEVTGYSLDPPTTPSFFEATSLGERLAASIIGDIRHRDALAEAMDAAQPSIVFHLAAQPLVRRAYAEPHLTFDTNMMGTVNVLEAARACGSVKAVLAVTTDKVYRNNNQCWPYRENDPLGGREPYSASKAAAEIVLDAYRNAYFGSLRGDDSGIGLAAIRAGNIFGGGDWGVDRLVPDAVRSFSAGSALVLRNPGFTRPWQHVLDPLPGYLILAERLYKSPSAYSDGWNYGPAVQDCRPVSELTELLRQAWGGDARVEIETDSRIFEEQLLALDSSKAAHRLDWTPKWPLETAVARTVDWYKAFYENGDLWALSQAQCAEIMEDRR